MKKAEIEYQKGLNKGLEIANKQNESKVNYYKKLAQQKAEEIFDEFEEDLRKAKGSMVLTTHRLLIKKKKHIE